MVTSDWFPASRAGDVMKKFEAFCRKCGKNGWAKPTFKVLGSRQNKWGVDEIRLEFEQEDLVVRDVNGVELTILGLAKFDGDEPTLHTFGETDLLGQLGKKREDLDRGCDHCSSNRKRKKIFFFRNESSKEIVQVGSTCVQVYAGMDVEKACRVMEKIGDSCERMGKYVSQHWPVSAEFALSVAAEMMRKGQRFVSAKFAEENNVPSFARLLKSAILDKVYVDDDDIDPRDLNLAKKTIEWALAQADKNDYWFNVRTALRNKDIYSDEYRENNLGIVAPLIHLFKKNAGAENSPQRPQASAWIGTIGERSFAEIEYVGESKEFRTEYGTSKFVKFTTPDGRMLSLMTSSDKWKDFRGLVSFEVRNHSEFRGVRETLAGPLRKETPASVAKFTPVKDLENEPSSEEIEKHKKAQAPRKGECGYLVKLAYLMGSDACSHPAGNGAVNCADCRLERE